MNRFNRVYWLKEILENKYIFKNRRDIRHCRKFKKIKKYILKNMNIIEL